MAALPKALAKQKYATDAVTWNVKTSPCENTVTYQDDDTELVKDSLTLGKHLRPYKGNQCGEKHDSEACP
jgi:hypothetical protein